MDILKIFYIKYIIVKCIIIAIHIAAANWLFSIYICIIKQEMYATDLDRHI